MKISCDVIKDLLPLYFDGVCSSDSKAEVEEHLMTCESCKSELQGMKMSLPIKSVEQNLQDAEAVKNLSKRWKRGMKKSLIKGILITIVTLAAIALILHLFIGFQIVY